jgi:hypothetical protein
MAEQKISEQIVTLQYLVGKLKDFVREFSYYVIEEPDKVLLDAVSMGFPIEIEQRYRYGYYEKNKQDAETIISDIVHLHIPYLERVIEDLKEALIRK